MWVSFSAISMTSPLSDHELTQSPFLVFSIKQVKSRARYSGFVNLHHFRPFDRVGSISVTGFTYRTCALGVTTFRVGVGCTCLLATVFLRRAFAVLSVRLPSERVCNAGYLDYEGGVGGGVDRPSSSLLLLLLLESKTVAAASSPVEIGDTRGTCIFRHRRTGMTMHTAYCCPIYLYLCGETGVEIGGVVGGGGVSMLSSLL